MPQRATVPPHQQRNALKIVTRNRIVHKPQIHLLDRECVRVRKLVCADLLVCADVWCERSRGITQGDGKESLTSDEVITQGEGQLLKKEHTECNKFGKAFLDPDSHQ